MFATKDERAMGIDIAIWLIHFTDIACLWGVELGAEIGVEFYASWARSVTVSSLHTKEKLLRPCGIFKMCDYCHVFSWLCKEGKVIFSCVNIEMVVKVHFDS